MVHYVLLKFKENTLTEDVFNTIAAQYEELEKRMDGLTNPQIYRNIVTRDSNMDLMITVELAGREDLSVYLESETHQTLAERLGDILEMRVSFDHN